MQRKKRSQDRSPDRVNKDGWDRLREKIEEIDPEELAREFYCVPGSPEKGKKKGGGRRSSSR